MEVLLNKEVDKTFILYPLTTVKGFTIVCIALYNNFRA